ALGAGIATAHLQPCDLAWPDDADVDERDRVRLRMRVVCLGATAHRCTRQHATDRPDPRHRLVRTPARVPDDHPARTAREGLSGPEAAGATVAGGVAGGHLRTPGSATATDAHRNERHARRPRIRTAVAAR